MRTIYLDLLAGRVSITRNGHERIYQDVSVDSLIHLHRLFFRCNGHWFACIHNHADTAQFGFCEVVYVDGGAR